MGDEGDGHLLLRAVAIIQFHNIRLIAQFCYQVVKCLVKLVLITPLQLNEVCIGHQIGRSGNYLEAITLLA